MSYIHLWLPASALLQKIGRYQIEHLSRRNISRLPSKPAPHTLRRVTIAATFGAIVQRPPRSLARATSSVIRVGEIDHKPAIAKSIKQRRSRYRLKRSNHCPQRWRRVGGHTPRRVWSSRKDVEFDITRGRNRQAADATLSSEKRHGTGRQPTRNTYGSCSNARLNAICT